MRRCCHRNARPGRCFAPGHWWRCAVEGKRPDTAAGYLSGAGGADLAGIRHQLVAVGIQPDTAATGIGGGEIQLVAGFRIGGNADRQGAAVPFAVGGIADGDAGGNGQRGLFGVGGRTTGRYHRWIVEQHVESQGRRFLAITDLNTEGVGAAVATGRCVGKSIGWRDVGRTATGRGAGGRSVADAHGAVTGGGADRPGFGLVLIGIADVQIAGDVLRGRGGGGITQGLAAAGARREFMKPASISSSMVSRAPSR